MNKYVAALGVTLHCLSMLGCASEPDRPEPVGYFVTHIDEDGTKNYQYTLELEPPDQESRGGRPGNTTGHLHGNSRSSVSGGITAGTGRRHSSGMSRQGSQARYQQINARLENMLEMELKNSRYCHTGSRELERVVNPPTFFIRGKCEEAASEEDQLRFPNNT